MKISEVLEYSVLYKDGIDSLLKLYNECDGVLKIKITVDLMDEISKLCESIKCVESKKISESNIDLYRRCYYVLESMKYSYRYYSNVLKSVQNSTISICKEINSNNRLERYICNVDLNKKFKCSINKEESVCLSILKEVLLRYKNNIIMPHSRLDVKYKRYLWADFLVYVNYFKNVRLVVEYDGLSHYDRNYIYYVEENEIRDKIKDNYCINNGISVLRYNNQKKLKDLLCQVLIDIDRGLVVKSCHYRDVYEVLDVGCEN